MSCSGLLLLAALALAPRPLDRSDPLAGDGPRAQAVAAVEQAARALAEEVAANAGGGLSAGWAAVAFEIPEGAPLAGYGARAGAAHTGTRRAVTARAVALDNGRSQVVVLAPELLLVAEALRDRIVERSGLEREQLLFTASHTHSGPGGWGRHPLETAVVGAWDEAVVEAIVDACVRAVAGAREQLAPAAWGWVSVDAGDRVRNRTVAGGPVDPRLEALVLARPNPDGHGHGWEPRAALVVYAAHATCHGPDLLEWCGDYPGALIEALEGEHGLEFAAFASGAVGSQGPVAPEGADEMGRELAARLAPAMAELDAAGGWQSRARLGTALVPLQADLSLRLGDGWRLSPWLTRRMRGPDSEWHLVRLGERLLVGLPVEVSAMLTEPWRLRGEVEGVELVPLCFNGNYLGYVLPDQLYDQPSYESGMSFLGPHGGSWVDELLRVSMEAQWGRRLRDLPYERE